MLDQVIKEFADAVIDTDRELAIQVVRKAIDEGVSPEDIVFKVVIPTIESVIDTVGEKGNVNLAQSFLTAQISTEVVEEMVARFKAHPEIIGRVIIGTSAGDFHGLGKRIVSGCLRANMIDVVDLGLNVAPEKFVDEAIAQDADVIGISSMMVHTAIGENGCLRVRELLRSRDLEDRIKIVVGGVPYRFDPELYKRVEADAWAENGIVASQVIKDLIAEAQK